MASGGEENLSRCEPEQNVNILFLGGNEIRIRKDKKGPKTKKNRTRYSTEWREPKLLCIYFLDENGEVDRSISPVLDGNDVSSEREVKALQKNSRKGNALRTASNYLLKHSRSGHMNYAEARRLNLPIGSGVIESTIRRVVNLRSRA